MFFLNLENLISYEQKSESKFTLSHPNITTMHFPLMNNAIQYACKLLRDGF